MCVQACILPSSSRFQSPWFRTKMPSQSRRATGAGVAGLPVGEPDGAELAGAAVGAPVGSDVVGPDVVGLDVVGSDVARSRSTIALSHSSSETTSTPSMKTVPVLEELKLSKSSALGQRP